ncbi:MAG: hypothetical protein MUF10_19160 [Thermoanaerobaculaceae bacterium]|nr:hypothetical protein [Thermoanaerobaculaceae bacterium]
MLTGGLFWALRQDAGTSTEVSGHFWRTPERGADAALADFVADVIEGAPGVPVEVRHLDMPVGRVAALEAATDDAWVLVYAFIDPRVAETCATHDGGYYLRFSFPVSSWTPAAARAEAEVIVGTAAMVPFDAQYLAAMTDTFLCPVEPSPLE